MHAFVSRLASVKYILPANCVFSYLPFFMCRRDPCHVCMKWPDLEILSFSLNCDLCSLLNYLLQTAEAAPFYKYNKHLSSAISENNVCLLHCRTLKFQMLLKNHRFQIMHMWRCHRNEASCQMYVCVTVLMFTAAVCQIFSNSSSICTIYRALLNQELKDIYVIQIFSRYCLLMRKKLR
jgi:hypothetical protein